MTVYFRFKKKPQVLRLALCASLRMTISLAGFGGFVVCASFRMTISVAGFGGFVVCIVQDDDVRWRP
jgi:hypothetical protein